MLALLVSYKDASPIRERGITKKAPVTHESVLQEGAKGRPRTAARASLTAESPRLRTRLLCQQHLAAARARGSSTPSGDTTGKKDARLLRHRADRPVRHAARSLRFRPAERRSARHEADAAYFFRQGKSGERVARAVLVDTEPRVVGEVEGGDRDGCRWVYGAANSVLCDAGLRGCANNWAKGFSSEKEGVNRAADVVRREMERS